MPESTTVTTSAGDSIEVSISTKGVHTYSAKVYGNMNTDEDRVVMQEKLEAIDTWFTEFYNKEQSLGFVA